MSSRRAPALAAPAAAAAAIAAAVAAAAVLALALAAVAGAGAAAPPTVTKLANGSTVTVTAAGRVTQRDAKGGLMADSECGSAKAVAGAVATLTALRAAVLAGDRDKVAALAAYPLRWNHGTPPNSTTISGKAALRRNYAAMFTPNLVAALRQNDPRAVFCKNGGQFTFGPGATWGEVVGGRPAIIAITSF